MPRKRSVFLMLIIFLTAFSSYVNLANAVTWSDNNQLTKNTSSDWSPSAIQTNDGKIWVVWHSYRAGIPNSEIYYNLYDGDQWFSDEYVTTNMRLTTNSGQDMLPSIMQAQDGKIWVVWASDRTGNFEIFYITYDGSNWSTAQTIPEIEDPSEDKSPDIIQTTDGKIWLVWQTNRTGNDDIYYTFSSDNGANWALPESLTQDYLYEDASPSIIQAANGTIMVVWARSAEIFYRTYNGVGWSDPTFLTGVTEIYDLHPSIMQTNDGNIWVMWQSNRNYPQDDLFYKIYDGTRWSEDTQLTVDTYLDIMPSIKQASDGTIWIFWASNRRNNFDIYYKTVSDFSLIHDVAPKAILLRKTSVYQGNTMNIYVQLFNEGTVSETFDVTTYYDGTSIETLTAVNLVPNSIYGGYLRLTFTWNTTNVPVGNYTLSATAQPVVGEIDVADNTLIDGTVHVKIPGDINGDDHVDVFDAVLLSTAFGSGPESPNWNPEADINDDQIVDVFDAVALSTHWTG